MGKRTTQPTQFGVLLKARRKTVGLTQVELAEMVEMNRIQYTKLETSPSANPTLDTINRLAAALRCPPADLIPPAAG